MAAPGGVAAVGFAAGAACTLSEGAAEGAGARADAWGVDDTGPEAGAGECKRACGDAAALGASFLGERTETGDAPGASAIGTTAATTGAPGANAPTGAPGADAPIGRGSPAGA